MKTTRAILQRKAPSWSWEAKRDGFGVWKYIGTKDGRSVVVALDNLRWSGAPAGQSWTVYEETFPNDLIVGSLHRWLCENEPAYLTNWPDEIRSTS